MEVDVREAARRMQVSERRVRQQVAAGSMPSRLVGGRWLVDEAGLPRSRRIARPMSERMAWGLIVLLSGGQPAVAPSERTRLKQKRDQLIVSQDAPRLLRSWLPSRAERKRFYVASSDLGDLRADPKVLLSGTSDPRSGIAATQEVELYVEAQDLQALAKEFLFSDKGTPNVTVHVARRPVQHGGVAPLGLVIADLADWDRPREDQQVLALLREMEL
jgi:hypothetical protein